MDYQEKEKEQTTFPSWFAVVAKLYQKEAETVTRSQSVSD